MNKALLLENHRGVMECKRKLVCQHQPGSSFRPHVGPPSAGPVFCPAQLQFQPRSQSAGQGFSTPQRQVIHRPNIFQTHATGNQSVQRTRAAQNLSPANQKCYACGEKGHVAIRCPNPRTCPPQQSVPAITHGANSIPIAVKQNYGHGRVNHAAMEEAQEVREVVIGMFSINDTFVVLLFDSKSSHSFISIAYVGKHNLPLALQKC
jgi:hypothetical protein